MTQYVACVFASCWKEPGCHRWLKVQHSQWSIGSMSTFCRRPRRGPNLCQTRWRFFVSRHRDQSFPFVLPSSGRPSLAKRHVWF